MSEGKGQIFIAHHNSSATMGINSKSYCSVDNGTSTNGTYSSQELTQEKICQSYEMLKYLNFTQNESTVVSESCNGEDYLPWRRIEASDVQLDFHRSSSRFNAPANDAVSANPYYSMGRTCHSADSDHDSMKCMNSCCYRLPTLPEGVSVCEVDAIAVTTNQLSLIPRIPSSPDVVADDVIPPPWKTVETEPPAPASAVPQGATVSSRTQSEQNSGPLYITDSTCYCTWTGTCAAHYRGSRRNSLVPTATGSSRRRCSQHVPAVERVSIFDGDNDEALQQQGRAERSWSWLLDSPMTIEDEEVRTRRNSAFLENDSTCGVTNSDLHSKGGVSGGDNFVMGATVGAGSGALSDYCLLPTAMQLLLARSHSACDLAQVVEHEYTSWVSGDQLRKIASVPNLAFI